MEIDDIKNFPFTEESEKELKKLNRDLEAVLREAREIGDLNFQIIEGKRDALTQEKMWYKGEAKEDNISAHRIGNAVKLGIYIENRLCFHWQIYAELASCIRYAAQNLNIGIRWSTVTIDLRLTEEENLLDLIPRAIKHAEGTSAVFFFIPNYFELVVD